MQIGKYSALLRSLGQFLSVQNFHTAREIENIVDFFLSTQYGIHRFDKDRFLSEIFIIWFKSISFLHQYFTAEIILFIRAKIENEAGRGEGKK